ncbi:GNAT family N-acetyltransferase [Paremcibacter congregatus]|uniref:GNAT family N-acetyltransferase n=1 Tax=Paremcibacter congregatus TaxID=2043170 RepID=UPI0030ECE4E2|tara:strand:+ start:6496 stop:6918 length:423 start_codon:yes stop_codon:yes gene_type:complete
MSYRLSFDHADQQLDVIHAYLAQAYWSPGIPRETVAKAIKGSLCIGVFAEDGAQVGFARVITDRATFAYLADVFIVDGHGGQGLAQRMVRALQDHPEMQGLRRWMLATSDAHGVYEKCGFTALANPDIMMEINRPDIYRK